MAYSKRDFLAFCNRSAALMDALGRFPKKPMLVVLNYHRIGDASGTEYDQGVFSVTPDQLYEQVHFLKRRMGVVDLDEALEMIETGKFRRTAALITFDDGYRDNYEAAYPALTVNGVKGVFFLPTAFVGTSRVAPWDSIAYIVRNSRKRRFRIPDAPEREFDLDDEPEAGVVEAVLNVYKRLGFEEPFLEALENACDVTRPSGSERLFMNWEEAAEMLRGGMAMESHSHNHPTLAQLSIEDAARDLSLSKHILESRLGKPVRCVSYPFGLQSNISEAVFRAAETAGYRAGFSFYGGYNLPGKIERFNVLREAVGPTEVGTFQIRTTLKAMSG